MRKASASQSASRQVRQSTLKTHECRQEKQAAPPAASPDPCRWPSPVVDSLTDATLAGKWLIAVFRVDGDQLQLDRTAQNFPRADLDLACRLFVESLNDLKK
ncbi:hypothetical protein [Schlesneria sp. DSM 10557]|uniref:hypothetical protein n=1 Tax=Schlesneria sp. DSM 10557 TaxID=3044399 RepID=UPI0035A09AF4